MLERGPSSSIVIQVLCIEVGCGVTALSRCAAATLACDSCISSPSHAEVSSGYSVYDMMMTGCA